MYKYNEDGKVYHGDWQFGDTIRQQLEGPIGEGAIDYPNGDRFDGFFHLSYACINGPAYAARGKYRFANGDIVPDCWIGSRDLLMGVYRMQCADGTIRITSWMNGRRWGITIIEGEQPVAIEYEDNVEKARWNEGVSYTYTENENGENVLTVQLPDGRSITQSGGEVEHSTSSPRCEVCFSNGDIFTFLGDSTYKDGQPWNGYGEFFDAKTCKSIRGEWADGVQTDEKATWNYDIRGAKRVMIPTDPLGNRLVLESYVWKDHIQYTHHKIYDGEMADELPHGKGVYVDDDSVGFQEEPRRYEGEFCKGLAHGKGVYTFPSAGIRQDGLWVNGAFVDEAAPESPIMLHVEWADESWTMGGGGSTERKSFDIEAKVGALDIEGFHSVHIEEVRRTIITFKEYGRYMKVLTPGESIHFSNSIDGYEDHEGCVWDGDDYSMTISWKS